MEKLFGMKTYFTDTADKVTKAWNWVSLKTHKEMKEKITTLEEQVEASKVTEEVLKIKNASTEIDLKASEIEKETIKIQLEEKKMQVVDLKLKINQIESSNVTSDIEFNQIMRRLKLKEEEVDTLKMRIFNVISMLCTMSENEKYQDIIKIQTNTIDEIGNENHSIYISYGGQTVELQTQDILEKEEASVETARNNDKIINFNPQALYEYDEDMMEKAE